MSRHETPVVLKRDPLVLARIRVDRLDISPVDRQRFEQLFITYRRLLSEGYDIWHTYRDAVIHEDSVVVAAYIEAAASLRTGPLVPYKRPANQ